MDVMFDFFKMEKFLQNGEIFLCLEQNCKIVLKFKVTLLKDFHLSGTSLL